MNINLSLIDDIIKNNIHYKETVSNTDIIGNPKENGSIEFEIIDNDNRIWGGRYVNDQGEKVLVEFFSKLFLSDVPIGEVELSANEIEKQLIDPTIDFD